MKQYCLACMTPSNPKSESRFRNPSFSQRRTEKSDSTVLVPGHKVAIICNFKPKPSVVLLDMGRTTGWQLCSAYNEKGLNKADFSLRLGSRAKNWLVKAPRQGLLKAN